MIFLYGVSKYLFTALALGVVLALAASYLVAMTVVPLFCARFIKVAHGRGGHQETKSAFGRFVARFNHHYNRMLSKYDTAVNKGLDRPLATVIFIMASFAVSLALFPLLGVAFFPRTDPGQFVISVKAPTGSRLEMTNQYVARVEDDIRQVIGAKDLKMIVSNIGLTPDLSSIYTSNSGQHTAFVQVSLAEHHDLSTFAYMRQVQQKLNADLPELSTYFLTGGLVDSVVNQGMPAPIDIQVSGNNQHEAYAVANRAGPKAEGHAQCERRFDSAGPQLSRTAVGCEARNGRSPRTDSQRRRQQCRHGAHLQRHDRPQLLGRSAQW